MSRSQSVRHPCQVLDKLPWFVVVETLLATHGLAGSGECAGCAEGHEDVESREGGNGAASGYATGDEFAYTLHKGLEDAVGLGDEGCDRDAN